MSEMAGSYGANSIDAAWMRFCSWNPRFQKRLLVTCNGNWAVILRNRPKSDRPQVWKHSIYISRGATIGTREPGKLYARRYLISTKLSRLTRATRSHTPDLPIATCRWGTGLFSLRRMHSQ